MKSWSCVHNCRTRVAPASISRIVSSISSGVARLVALQNEFSAGGERPVASATRSRQVPL